MKNIYLDNVFLGKNEWWRYVLTVLAMFVSAGLFMVISTKGIMPFVKTNFEKTPFTENIINFIMLLGSFGAVLIGLAFMINRLHQRSFVTLLYCKSKFSWKLWFFGFLAWLPIVFGLSLFTNYSNFEQFHTQNFSIVQVVILFLIGLVAVGIQSTTEEIVFRGYFLQGMSLKLKNTMLLVGVNSLIFALLHMGYGFQSLIESFVFGFVFSLVILQNKRIEFSAGMHTVNNLVFFIFFPMDKKELNQFFWEINLLSLGAFLVVIGLFYVLVRVFMKIKNEYFAMD